MGLHQSQGAAHSAWWGGRAILQEAPGSTVAPHATSPLCSHAHLTAGRGGREVPLVSAAHRAVHHTHEACALTQDGVYLSDNRVTKATLTNPRAPAWPSDRPPSPADGQLTQDCPCRSAPG